MSRYVTKVCSEGYLTSQQILIHMVCNGLGYVANAPRLCYNLPPQKEEEEEATAVCVCVCLCVGARVRATMDSTSCSPAADSASGFGRRWAAIPRMPRPWPRSGGGCGSSSHVPWAKHPPRHQAAWTRKPGLVVGPAKSTVLGILAYVLNRKKNDFFSKVQNPHANQATSDAAAAGWFCLRLL